MLWNCHNPERKRSQNLFCRPFDHQREDKLIRLLILLSLIEKLCDGVLVMVSHWNLWLSTTKTIAKQIYYLNTQVYFAI